MGKFLASLLVLTALPWLTPTTARACSCLEQPFETAHESAVAIFEGRAASIAPADDGRLLVTFDVVQTWRAANHEHVEVLTASNGAACGYTFEVGTSYLVYAASAEGERYVVSLCSRTARMADADGDRALLGSGVVPVDIVDDPESESPAPRPPPTRAGCASCSVGARGSSGPTALALIGLAIAVLARRSRS
jgi:MYXO-CTERM domain-containing protein